MNQATAGDHYRFFPLVLFALIGVVSSSSSVCSPLDLEVLYEWNILEYETPSNFQTFRLDGTPIFPQNSSYFTGVEATSKEIFLAVPKILTYTHPTVVTIPHERRGSRNASPKLKPFPSAEWHTLRHGARGNDCDHTLISVLQMAKDKCNRLWVLDTGKVFSITQFNKQQQICPHKIVIFDLNTNEAVKIVRIPSSVLPTNAALTEIILDYGENTDGESEENSCDNVYAYLADGAAPGIVVYKSPDGEFQRFTHSSMYPQPGDGTIRIDGESFENFYGVNGMSIVNRNGERRLFYQAVAARRVYSLPVIELQSSPPKDPSMLSVREEIRKSSQGITLFTEPSTGCVLFNPISQNSIVGWDQSSEKQRILVRDQRNIKVVHDIEEDAGVIYVASNRLQKFYNNNVNPNEINLQVLRGRLRSQ